MKKIPPRIETLAAGKQRRLDGLLDKNSEGTITPKEKARLEQLVAEAERLMVANARKVATFLQDQDQIQLKGRIPVTVWLQAEEAEH